MRLVRLDHLPGGRSLELHPRLTVLLGAPAEVTRALEHLLRSLVAADPVPFDGQVELHGIRLGLHDRAFEVDGVSCVDPVLDLGAPMPLRPVRPARQRRADPRPIVDMRPVDVGGVPPPPPATRAGSGTPEDPAQHTRRIASDDLIRLRAELRSLDGERNVLERRTTEARAGLDSFARATLDVAVGQLEAVEARRSAASAERSGWYDERADRRAELTGRIDTLHGRLGALSSTSTDEQRVVIDRLVALRGSAAPSTARDAERVADRLEEIRHAQEEARTRRRATEALLTDAELRLARARRELDEGSEAAAGGDVVRYDPDVVRSLEVVRDELVALEEGRRDVVDDRNRLVELRSEEALLLDRLGFETYTAFVMGAQTASAAAAQHRRHEEAAARLSEAHDEVQRIRSELSDTAEDEGAVAERAVLIDAAAGLLGVPAPGLSRLTTAELVDLLRTAQLVASLEEAESELAELDRADVSLDDGGRDADLEAEAQQLRLRVAECEAAVARHQRATAELADLRAQELEIRDRERDLLVRISDRERLLDVLDLDAPPPAGTGPADVVPLEAAPVEAAPVEVESLRRRVERDASIAWPVDREWQLLARLGEVRSVGSVGSVPLLVTGIDASSLDTPALLHRISSMSELVQLVVCGEDERLARWAGGLGADASLIRW